MTSPPAPPGMKRAVFLRRLAWESARSGTIASLAMMPVGGLFRLLDLRVGHYGRRLAELLFGNPPEPTFRAILLAQHFVIGWLSAAPLLLLLARSPLRVSPWAAGTLYGVAYYVAINSLLLPWSFGEPTPWQLGFDTIYPSLVVHIVFGLSIAWTSRRFVAAARPPVLRSD